MQGTGQWKIINNREGKPPSASRRTANDTKSAEKILRFGQVFDGVTWRSGPYFTQSNEQIAARRTTADGFIGSVKKTIGLHVQREPVRHVQIRLILRENAEGVGPGRAQYNVTGEVESHDTH